MLIFEMVLIKISIYIKDHFFNFFNNDFIGRVLHNYYEQILSAIFKQFYLHIIKL